MNLQLFAGEKTEKATPKRRREARRKGQVIKSSEVNSALVLLVSFLTIKLLGTYFINEIDQFTKLTFVNWTQQNLTFDFVLQMGMALIYIFFKLSLPVLLVTMLAGIAANLFQVGFLFTSETLQMKLSRINPVEGFKRIFSKRALMEFVKSLLKLVLISGVVYLTIKGNLQVFPTLIDMSLGSILGYIGDLSYTIGWRCSLILLVIALGDYFYQHWEYENSLKMSKEELKEEYKETEGHPQLRAKVREKQRQVAMARMMQEVPRADVVITNPVHLAVAIRYDADKMAAPVVIAKGQELLAERMKDIARENGVIIVENKPLAQALFRTVEIGQAIPEELYKAVAEVLAFVYKLQGKI